MPLAVLNSYFLVYYDYLSGKGIIENRTKTFKDEQIPVPPTLTQIMPEKMFIFKKMITEMLLHTSVLNLYGILCVS